MTIMLSVYPLPIRCIEWLITQALFFVAEQGCETSHNDRKGKHDKPLGVVPARVIT